MRKRRRQLNSSAAPEVSARTIANICPTLQENATTIIWIRVHVTAGLQNFESALQSYEVLVDFALCRSHLFQRCCPLARASHGFHRRQRCVPYTAVYRKTQHFKLPIGIETVSTQFECVVHGVQFRSARAADSNKALGHNFQLYGKRFFSISRMTPEEKHNAYERSLKVQDFYICLLNQI